ncbi:hypothetical protein O181_001808 [Austropuccinia psidii MF-1]|uniref:Chromo domain-containing protein n=1 Tax=Austropuccinia psidii MF-1 TaxID=1389203 RepID=A0A9Q3BB90_9BASI|nr:hypothetical protein [Austropuccinia psidii MF-1]
MYPERGVDLMSKNTQTFHPALKQNEIQEYRFFSIKVKMLSDVIDQIQKEVLQDKYEKEVLKKLAREESVSDYSFETQAKLLLFKDRVVISINNEIQLDILQKCHDSLLAGHPGQEKTLKLIKRDFYWAGMNRIIKDYVSSCQKCAINKIIHHKRSGLLKPLRIPSEVVKKSTIPNQHQFPPPPVIVEEQEEWEVAQVLDSKFQRGKLWYLVEWKGFSEDPERETWEPASSLTNSPDLVRDFHTLYPDKPGPNASRV